MAIHLFNTLTRTKEPFVPLEPPKVRMYNCGPTVYNFAHIGNFRAFMLADLLRRYLEYRGYDVLQVMNITDVGHLTDDSDEGEDKIEATARRERIDPYEIVDRYIRAFQEDIEILRLKHACVYPRATEHIPEMIAMIEALIANGYAYVVNGAVYYEVARFSDYGQLSGNTMDQLRAGARIDVNPDKRSPLDFALWKCDSKHLMQWDSPWGRGFPGWHIECSAMSTRYLGDTLDIHTGGEDNIFPHHECEIAQSEGALARPFVRFWLHTRHLLVNGTKMSKSAGNFYTLRDLVEKGYDGPSIRYALLSTHYRQQYNLTFEGLDGARRAVERINDFVRNLTEDRETGPASSSMSSILSGFERQFIEAMDDDLNVSLALGHLFDFMRDCNKESLGAGDAQRIREVMERIDGVVAILDTSAGELDRKVAALVEAREKARREKDFAHADEIRDQIKEMGFVLEDTPHGVRWKRA